MPIIKFHVLLLLCILTPTLLSATKTPLPMTKPNCTDHCGNISIPFPFGTTEKCSYNPNYLVNCTETPGIGQQIFFGGTYVEIKNISLDKGQLRMMQYIAKICYDPDGTQILNQNTRFQIDSDMYSVSNTANKFTIIGCDSNGYISGRLRSNRSYSTGCTATCSEMNDLEDGSCMGLGCCQTSEIPKDILWLNLTVRSFNNHTEVMGFNNCTYGLLAEEGAFTFYRENLTNLMNVEELPSVVDWVIGREKCDSARKNSTRYACISPDSECFEPINGEDGYRCRCKAGYEGNPYLSDGRGCRDINECDSAVAPRCMHKCVNWPPGNFTCVCPKGYIVDGDDRLGCSCPKGFYSDGDLRNGGCISVKLRISKPVAGLISATSFLALLSLTFGLTKFVKKKKNQRRRQKFFKQNGGLLLKQETSANEGILRKTRIFTAKELEKATDRFNETRILGQGGQGTVYKGMLSDGQIVAIKKSKLVDESKSKHLVEQFINEVVILSLISHRNVVKLLGCCLETRIPLLVYEFMPNGTLSDLIQGKNIEFPFTWAMRLKIAADVGGALAYLHNATSIPIFHRDVKSSNILLDEKFISKVSDFGTSKSVEVDRTHLTTMVNGTFGYIDPEYFQSSQFTGKSDVYSFGVVLVELLTGLKPIMASTNTEDDKSLVSRFLSSMRDKNLELILEGQVSGEVEKAEVVAVAELAKRCLHLNGKKRPYMKEVAMELETVRKSGMKSNDTTELPEYFTTSNATFSIEDSEYGWTHTSYFDTTSSDVHPIMFHTI